MPHVQSDGYFRRLRLGAGPGEDHSDGFFFLGLAGSELPLLLEGVLSDFVEALLSEEALASDDVSPFDPDESLPDLDSAAADFL